MARSIDKIEDMVLVEHAHGLQLDGNTTLTFQVHLVEHLLFHVPGAHCLSHFQHTVSQGGLTVINMSNDAEVADGVHEKIKKGDPSGYTRFDLLCQVTVADTFRTAAFANLRLAEPGLSQLARLLWWPRLFAE